MITWSITENISITSHCSYEKEKRKASLTLSIPASSCLPKNVPSLISHHSPHYDLSSISAPLCLSFFTFGKASESLGPSEFSSFLINSYSPTSHPKGNFLREVSFDIQFSSVHFSRSVMSDSLRPHESQHTRPPCPSPTPGVHSDSRPSSQRYHPAISSSVVPFSSCPQSFPASESFPMSQLFA